MKRIVKITAALAVAALLIAPGAAQALDGNVYAYENTNRTGNYCYWSGNSGDWSWCGMLNRASSLWNNGYVGGNDDVNFYWGRGYTGAWDCLPQGARWDDLGQHWFAYGAGLNGYLQTTNNNIESHKWVSYCGQR